MTDDARTPPFPGLKVVRHSRRDVSHHFDFLHFFRKSACSFVWLSVIVVWFALGCSEDRYHQYEFEREPFADKDLDPDETPELEENETDLDLESDQADPPDTSEETPNDIIVLCEESLQYCGDDPLFFDGTERCEKLETEEGGWRRILCQSSSTYDTHSQTCRNHSEIITLEICSEGCSSNGAGTECTFSYSGRPRMEFSIDVTGGDADNDEEQEQTPPIPHLETACSTDLWCWSDARPFGGDTYNVFAPDPSHVWMIGDMGLVFHDGESWTEEAAIRYKVPRDLCGTSADNVWVVGDDALVIQWKGDGSPFWRTHNPVPNPSEIDLKAVDITNYSFVDEDGTWDVSSVMAVGSPRKILWFEGKTRESQNPPGTVREDIWSVIDPPDEKRLEYQDVCQIARRDFWLVADEVWLYHHDPVTGWEEPRRHHSRINAIRCAPGEDLLIAESSLQGYALSYLSPLGSVPLRSVDKEITRIMTKEDGRIAAATVGGKVLRWQGGRWIEDLLVYGPTGTFPNLYGVDWDDEGNFWAVGNEVFYLPVEEDWQAVTTGLDLPWRTICAMSQNELWVAGDQGKLARYNGEEWFLASSEQNETLRASIAVPSNRTVDSSKPYLFFGGDNAALLAWDGNSWQTYPNPNGSDGPVLQEGAWRDLWYDETTEELWAVGDEGWIIHGDFKDWQYISTPVENCTINAIWGARDSGSLMIYAGGDKPGCFYRYDGRTLNFVTDSNAPTQNIMDIGGTGFQSVYVTTTTGLYRFGGWNWSLELELTSGRHFLFTSSLEQHIVSSFDEGRAQSLRRLSTGWTRSELLYGGELYDITGVSYFDSTARRYAVWAVGEHGILTRSPDP